MSNKTKSPRKEKRFGFRLEPDRAAEFERQAERDGGISSVLRRLIDSYLRRHKAA